VQAAIIYGEQSGTVRRVVLDDSAALLRRHPVARGEASIVVPVDPERAYPGPGDCIALVEEKTGIKALSDRCVVVGADGKVARVVLADPLIDVDADGVVKREAEAIVGDEFKDGVFYRSYKGELLTLEAAKAAADADAQKEADAPGKKG
jgi:hypothetical protein